MKKHGMVSKLVYTSVAFGLLASFTVLGCSPGTTPSPSAIPKQTPTSTGVVTPSPTATTTLIPTSKPLYGGTLKLAYRNEADSLGYPAKVGSLYTVVEAAPALETLLRIDTTGNQVPWLASNVTTDAVAKTITFTLRKGVKFQDGTDFNAAAVKWNLDQLVAAKTASTSMIASTDIVDDYTVRVNLSAWDSTVLGNFAQGAGMMISPAAFQANGLAWATKNPVGTGPFKFANWTPGVSISYNKFDGYWQQGKPYLDSVQFDFIVDDLTREFSLRAGEIDGAYALITTNLTKLQADGLTSVILPAGTGTGNLVFDSANPKSPFADIRVRQAAAYALNMPVLVKSVFGDLGAVVSNQLTYPGMWAYNPSVVGYPYNVAKAKQLLTAAGYPNGFQTRIQSYSDLQRQSIATGIQSYLQAVGINATMDVVTAPQLLQLQMSGKTWDGLAISRFSNGPDWVSAMSTIYNGHGSYVDMVVPDDYSQAINNAVAAPDFATKQKNAQQAMQLAVDKYALMIPGYGMVDTMTSWGNVHDTGLYTTNGIIWTPENAWLGKR